MDVIELLVADHRKVEELFEALGINVGDRAGLAGQLIDALTLHSEAEKTIVYPAMRAALGEDGPVDHALEEHAEVEQLLERLGGLLPDDAEFDKIVGTLRTNVEEHVGEEESDLFPRFRERTGDDEREQLGQQVAAMKEPGHQVSGHQVSGNQVSGKAEVSMDLSRKELYELAKDAGVEGRSKMTKEELVRALRG